MSVNTNKTPSNSVNEPNRITLDRFKTNSPEVLSNATNAQPTAIVREDGQVIMTVGLNGRKFFADPDPDPLDCIED